MFLTDSEVDKRLESPQNYVVKTRNEWAGNRNGKRLPEFMKVLIGTASRVDGPGRAAKEFEVSTGTSHALGRGQNTRGQEVNKELKEKISEKQTQIHDKAIDLLSESLGLVNISEAADLSIKEKLGVSERLARVVNAIAPTDAGRGGNGATFVVYAPNLVKTEDFPTITVETK